MGSSELLAKDKRIIKAGIAIIIFMVLSISYFYDPVFYKITDCAFKDITGMSCPGCGLSRSFHSVVNMEILSAFGFHILGPVFFLLLLLLAFLFSYEAISGNTINLVINKKIRKILVILIFAIWLFYWIIRMIVE